MRTITINRQKHVTLLADHRTDPITKVLLKVGDEVVACANCKTVFLADVWRGSLQEKCCVCEGSQTTDDIPNNENITFSKPKPKLLNGSAKPVKKISYAGTAIIFALAAIGLGVFAWNARNSATQEQEANSNLNSRIVSLSGEYNAMQSKIDNLQKEKDKLLARYAELADFVDSISMIGGIKVNDVGNYENDYGTTISTEKVHFSVKKPIVLKSVKVVSNSSGYLKLKVYNSFDDNVAETWSAVLTEGVNVIRFNNANLSPGRYYITIQEGNTSLMYLKAFKGYPVSSSNLLEITGTSYPEASNLYLYYFDWEYALQYKTRN